jgi:hypothetical protein
LISSTPNNHDLSANICVCGEPDRTAGPKFGSMDINIYTIFSFFNNVFGVRYP